MTAFLLAYAAGIVAFAEIAVPLIALSRRRKPGRHRARGRMTWAAEIALHADNEVSRIRKAWFRELVAEQVAPTWATWPAREYPPIGDRYAHKAGVGRYAHLRTEELTETAERKMRVAGFKEARRTQVVDLAVLRRDRGGALPTVAEVDDEWLCAVSA